MDKKIKEAENWYDKNKVLFEHFSGEVEEIITKILNNENISYYSISHRVKQKESYLNKCRNEKYVDPIEQILDVSGIRIIAYTNQEVSNICKVLQDEFLIDESNSINKADILETDKVGYLSIHYILQLNEKRLELPEYRAFKGLKCEVQVRTLLQHAWAEIEHDRNYKFAGVLPNAIKRRFHLVAGVLEMMDCEFDKLSKDIDEYIKNMQEAVGEGDYNLCIDSKSVEQYVLKRFDDVANLGCSYTGEVVTDEVVEELIRFGYKNIWEIENDFKKCHDKMKEHDTTYIGALRDLMILTDYEKYFRVAYKRAWQGASASTVNFWKKNGATKIENFLAEEDITIDEE